jgi:GDP/UDP-N,N'-diacetylbacillosamine 2-epimerase (hydrolysing)
MKRKILIVTERRADYSKFRPIIYEIKNSKKLDYQLIVTGSHLLKEHGKTIRDIQKDGFRIKDKFDMYSKNRNDSGSDMAFSLGKAIIELSKIVKKSKPDIIISGFDIGANLAVAIVGAHMNIPVVHLEAGEVTGTIDEPIRHAISKFAHFHFTTNSFATKRLIKMGEDKQHIYTVGNPSLDGIKQIQKIPIKQLEKEFNLDFQKPFVIIMQHTVTSELNQLEIHITQTLNAIKDLGIQSLIIHGNADAGSKKISSLLKKSKITQFETIPFEKYINLLKNCSALVGNSSSGKMEAPFLKIPSINIGTRQSGRPKTISVIDVPYNKNKIKKAIKKAIENKKFLNTIKTQKSLYGNGNSSKKIVKILETINLNKIPIQKKLTY